MDREELMRMVDQRRRRAQRKDTDHGAWDERVAQLRALVRGRRRGGEPEAVGHEQQRSNLEAVRQRKRA